MFHQLQVRYPKGSLITELLTIKHGKYVVQALVVVEGITLATGLAAADTIEMAEDRARSRVLAVLDISPQAEEKESLFPSPPEPNLSPPSPSLYKGDAGELGTTSGISARRGQGGDRSSASPSPSPAAASKPVPPTPVPSPQKTAFEQESLHGRPPVLSEPVPIDTPGEEKTIPISTTQGNQPPTLSSPLYEENEKVGGKEPIQLPFADDYHRDEAEMSTFGDVYEFETPKVMQSLPPRDVLPMKSALGREETPETELHPPSRTPENGGNKDTKEPQSRETPSNNSDNNADLTARTNLEIKRLGWSPDRGRDYLTKTYNKRSRSMLTEQEFQDFLLYLQDQPTPED